MQCTIVDGILGQKKDIRGKNEGKLNEVWTFATNKVSIGSVGFPGVCVCACACPCAQLSLTLRNPVDCSPPGSLCPWNLPGKNTGVSCHFLLYGIFLTQGSNLCLLLLLYWQASSLPLSHLGICLPMQEMQFRSLGQEDRLEKEMATYSSILAWEIPWTEEPGGLLSIGSQRVRHD